MSFEIVAAPNEERPSERDLRQELVGHPVYRSVNTRARLATFMQHHVFAVWDFMSLLKRLESDLTRQSIPWTPGPNAWLTREIYQIVQGEECDALPDGRIMSHFEAYLEAMRMLDVDTSAIDTFLEQLKQGVPAARALLHPNIPPAAATFTAESLDMATKGSTAEVAAAFFFGREDIIPDMFIPLLNTVQDVPESALLRWYFQRHVELDSGPHAQIAQKMLKALTSGSEEDRQRSTQAKKRALIARYRLWDGVIAAFDQ